MSIYALSPGYAYAGSIADENAEMFSESEAISAKYLGVVSHNSRPYVKFKVGRKFAYQMLHMCREKIAVPTVATIADVCDVVQSLKCHWISVYNNDAFDIQADYLEIDRRVCIEVRFWNHSTRIKVATLSGYDSDKGMWMNEVSNVNIVIEGKAGRKKLTDLFRSVWDTADKYRAAGHAHKFSANRRDRGPLVVYCSR